MFINIKYIKIALTVYLEQYISIFNENNVETVLFPVLGAYHL